MAFNAYIACDSCGNDPFSWTNKTVSVTYATKKARQRGWKVGKNGWYCPNCLRKQKEENRNGKC